MAEGVVTLDELLMRLGLGEDQDIEFKTADGGLPKSLWESFSAFSNTDGGYVVLGIAEKGSEFHVGGVRNVASLRKSFWDGHNNPQKPSVQLCSERSFTVADVGYGAVPDSEQSTTSSEHSDDGSEHLEALRRIAGPIRDTGRAQKQMVRRVLLDLCRVDFLTLRTLAELLGRSPDSIRNHYLTPMLGEGLIELRFPDSPNHPNQGYRTRHRS